MKLWDDCTKVNERYVAKDVKGMIAFAVGLVLLILSAIGKFFALDISVEPGSLLLAYSLGNQAFKSHYQVKNNEVLNACQDTESQVKE